MQRLMLIAGGILVVGVLVLSSQQLFESATGGVSADRLEYPNLPETIEFNREEYTEILGLLDDYNGVSDLARKNVIVGQLRAVLVAPVSVGQ